MYARLVIALNSTRNSLVDVCESLGIDPSTINPDLLDVESCCNCGIWGMNHTHEDGLPICHFCNEIDSLRF
jgi:hypothetical protein